MQQARQTAYKIWISNLLNGSYIKQPGEWDPNFVLCKDKKISRVNLLATVINIELSENMGSLTLDDGSATIQVRAFKEDVGLLREATVGDVVLIIGRPREFQNSLYVTAEIIKKVENPAWMTVRKLELTKLFGEPEKVQPKQVQPQVVAQQQEPGKVILTTTTPPVDATAPPKSQDPVTESGRQAVLNLVEKAGEAGMDMEQVISQSQLPEQDAETIIQELLKDGEIYMPRPGQVKIV